MADLRFNEVRRLGSVARRCDSREASLRFFCAEDLARAWRALNLSCRSLAFAAASDSTMGASSIGAASGAVVAVSLSVVGTSSAGSAVGRVFLFFAAGMLDLRILL